MVAVVAALYDEAYLLLKELSYDNTYGVRQYRGLYKGVQLHVYLMRPGIKGINKLIKFCQHQPFSSVVNVGFAGALTKENRIGEIKKVDYVIDFSTMKKSESRFAYHFNSNTTEYFTKIPEESITAKKTILLTAPYPVFDSLEKEDIHLRTAADLVDMEGYKLAQIFETHKIRAPLTLIKITGDSFDDHSYLKQEQQFQSFFSSRSFFTRIKIIFKTGLLNSISIYKRKRLLQKQFLKAVNDYLDKQRR